MGGYTRVGGGLAMGVGKKNRSDVGEGGKRAVREKRRRGGERKGLRAKREENGSEATEIPGGEISRNIRSQSLRD